ncbi:unnamed protein product [Rangifer tarandus platyrhynchus]|uniref:Uncharacterized protein n=1 Tax=Rangifer tarandus platyrhynchus TaxID=3082113 RepID=A0ABN8Z9I7_RANTA|nr:unnamed protein product [Rangifer tarandus platyrhynchus]CAI9688493.1 unnamed protein product [Rangifer tarandus platyrhynchus]
MGLEGWQERKRLGQGSRCQVLETWSSGRKEGQRPDKRRWGARRFPHRSLCRSTKAPVTGVLARATAGGCARGSTHSHGLDALPPPAALARVPAPARTCPRFLKPSTPAVGAPRTPDGGPRARRSAVPRAEEGGGGHAPAGARTADPGGGGGGGSCRLRAAPAPQPAPCPRRSRPGECPRWVR